MPPDGKYCDGGECVRCDRDLFVIVARFSTGVEYHSETVSPARGNGVAWPIPHDGAPAIRMDIRQEQRRIPRVFKGKRLSDFLPFDHRVEGCDQRGERQHGTILGCIR